MHDKKHSNPAPDPKSSLILPEKRKRGGQTADRIQSYDDSLRAFADSLKALQRTLDFHMGARDWCYALEPRGLKKSDFNWAQGEINEARLRGYLPPGFILEEDGHAVDTFADPDDESPEDYVEFEYERYQSAQRSFEICSDYFDAVNFWKDKPYYIQLLVEKAGLKSLFGDICKQYRISVANMRGWGSMEQKAVMARRFAQMQEGGHVPVLLACGDFDPPGLCISSSLRKQFEDYKLFTGWDPAALVIERIGLSYEFIQENGLTWIEGLGTGGTDASGKGRDLSDPKHPFYQRNTYDIRGYIKKYGKRKCESNAVVVVPELGRQILLEAIERYIGADAWENYEAELKARRQEIDQLVLERLEEEKLTP